MRKRISFDVSDVGYLLLNSGVEKRTADYERICDDLTRAFSEGVQAKRIFQCQACYIFTNGRCYLISYRTVVGFYDCESKEVTYFGRYSMTTYQHERKWENVLNYEEGRYIQNVTNLNLIDWFH